MSGETFQKDGDASNLDNASAAVRSPVPVIAIFDVGKTNKKVFLFDENYRMVYEKTDRLPETYDEDGDVCEDLSSLTEWVRKSFETLLSIPRFLVKAVNFSAYGASLVHIMQAGKKLLPLYNYLKPYPQNLLDDFCNTYGGKLNVSRQTASRISGNLNSGLQLYRIRHLHPELYESIDTSLHLPQYLSFLLTGQQYSDITSIGCHTSLWDFDKQQYHEWVFAEKINQKLAPIKRADEVSKLNYNGREMMAGIGLHDSSAALIPYLVSFTEPFVLISTGTWCVSLNPFNSSPLTAQELDQDSLCYLQYQGLPVKANRLFAGYEHEQAVQQLATYFHTNQDHYKTVRYDPQIINMLTPQQETRPSESFPGLEPEAFPDYESAYHQLMINIISMQTLSTRLVVGDSPIKRIFVDGGFSNNPVYMNLLAQAFPGIEVFAASMAQSTALGAALALHQKWNPGSLPNDIISLKFFAYREE